MKHKKNSLRFRHGLLLAGLLFLSACGARSVEEPQILTCPPYPVAGPAVAAELETLNPDNFQATEEWLGRIDKLADQLEVCK